MFRASTSTGILGARVCSLCRTYCDCNRWLRFSPYRVLRLHMHLSWGTSRQYVQCLRRDTQVLEYAAPFAKQQVASTLSMSSPHSCGVIHCAGTSIARCTLPLVEYIAPAPSVYVAPAPVMVYIALASAVSYAAPVQVLEYFAPAPVAYYAFFFCDCNRWFQFSPCRAHRLHLHL